MGPGIVLLVRIQLMLEELVGYKVYTLEGNIERQLGEVGPIESRQTS